MALATNFPELAHLSSVSIESFFAGCAQCFFTRREDLEDLISDPVFFQAMFHSLGCVKDLYRSQAELGMANEAIASGCILQFNSYKKEVFRNSIENNLALQQRLYELRSETKDAFDEAKRLEARWKELEKEQKEIYQVF